MCSGIAQSGRLILSFRATTCRYLEITTQTSLMETSSTGGGGFPTSRAVYGVRYRSIFLGCRHSFCLSRWAHGKVHCCPGIT